MEKYATIRVKKSDVDMLKILKDVMKVKTLAGVIRDMAHTELSKSYASTMEGYLPVGTKVVDEDNHIKVIEKVEAKTSLGPEVFFTDGSSAMNSSRYVWNLKKVANKEEVMEEVRNAED